MQLIVVSTVLSRARLLQGFEIHGSTGAPLPEKKYRWQKKKIEKYLSMKKNPQKKEKMGLRMLILWLKPRSPSNFVASVKVVFVILLEN